MENFAHIKGIVSIILSLSLANILKGAVKFIVHPGRSKPYWIHLLWAFYIFIFLLHFWWWEVYLNEITNWVFTKYLFIIGYIMIYFVISHILFPDDLKDYTGYKDYFYSRHKWLYGFLAVLFAADFIDTMIKGKEYSQHLGWELAIRNATHIILCLIGIRAKSPLFHGILIITFIVYELLLIFRLYYH